MMAWAVRFETKLQKRGARRSELLDEETPSTLFAYLIQLKGLPQEGGLHRDRTAAWLLGYIIVKAHDLYDVFNAVIALSSGLLTPPFLAFYHI